MSQHDAQVLPGLFLIKYLFLLFLGRIATSPGNPRLTRAEEFAFLFQAKTPDRAKESHGSHGGAEP